MPRSRNKKKYNFNNNNNNNYNNNIYDNNIKYNLDLNQPSQLSQQHKTKSEKTIKKTTKDDKDREELEIERKVWSKCSLCEEEYSKQGTIRMNSVCLHSYCLECIEQSASTSLLCPICHSSLPSPLSSLPINFTLRYWQTLSPPPPPFSLLNNYKQETIIGCDECENNKAEYNCLQCESSLCSSCSLEIHSKRITRNHTLSPITSSLKSPLSSLPVTSPIIHFYQCELHNQRAVELYCMTCNECICVDCLSDFHKKHSITNVLNRAEDIKEEWKKGVKEASNFILNNQLNEVDNICEKLSKEIDQVNEEIKQLEETLKEIKEKRERMMGSLKKLKESKENVNQTTRFLLSFLQSLPPLPLSSILPSSSLINHKADIKINTKMANKAGRIRIYEFFETKNLYSLFFTLIPPPSTLNKHNDNQMKKYSKEERDNRNKTFLSNRLIQNQNLISHFGSKESEPNQFNGLYYVTCNDKLNMIAVSDYNNNRVKIMDKNGSLIRSFPVVSPRGIEIIPSLLLLAVISNTEPNPVIEMFDISPLLHRGDSPVSNKFLENPLPLLYAIGGDDLNNPRGIRYSKGKDMLVLSENQRIVMFKIRRDGYENIGALVHSFAFKPYQIAISSPGDLILVSDNTKVIMYNELIKEGKGGTWTVRELQYPSLQPPLTTPSGIAINSPLNYFVICDYDHHRILFFNIKTRELLCSFQPTLPPHTSIPYFFQLPHGISVDDESGLISVTDIKSVTLLFSPIF